jgi:hypothetical protein
MTLLIKLTPTYGQTFVKGTVKTLIKNPMSLNVLRNFCSILQNSPKHFKISYIKVIQWFEEHNFHVGRHFNFWGEKGGKHGQL